MIIHCQPLLPDHELRAGWDHGCSAHPRIPRPRTGPGTWYVPSVLLKESALPDRAHPGLLAPLSLAPEPSVGLWILHPKCSSPWLPPPGSLTPRLPKTTTPPHTQATPFTGEPQTMAQEIYFCLNNNKKGSCKTRTIVGLIVFAVRWGCCNSMSQAGRLVNSRCSFLTVLAAASPRPRCWPVPCLVRAHSQLVDSSWCRGLVWRDGEGAPWGPLMRALSSLLRALPSQPHHLPKAQIPFTQIPPNTLGVRNLGAGTDIRSIVETDTKVEEQALAG